MALELLSEDRDALVAIRDLPPTQLDKFIDALQTAPPTSNPYALAEAVAPQLPAVSTDRLSGFLEALYSLYFVRELSGVKPSIFSNDVVRSILGLAQRRRAKTKRDSAKFWTDC